MPKRFLVIAAVLAVSLLAALSAYADGPTTVDRTIVDQNSDNRLDVGNGDGYVTRLLGHPSSNRDETRKRLINFGHITDTHIVDEESPARTEMFDFLIPSAQRAQESLESHVVGAMATRLNGITSPIDGAPVDNFVVTGDNTDNVHANEVQAYVAALNGGEVNPDSGDPTYDPDGFGIGGCDPATYPTQPYQGVRGTAAPMWEGFYDPDDDDGTANNDAPGYSENESENVTAKGRSVAMRDFAGLFEQAQDAFQSPGLGKPWYTAFGNHDSIMLGTLFGPSTDQLWAEIQGAALGCRKWLPQNGDKLVGDAGGLGGFIELLAGLTDDPDTFPIPTKCVPIRQLNNKCSLVTPDPNRQLLEATEWIDEHFDGTGPSTGNTPDGHGFADRPQDDFDGDGIVDTTYYSTLPKAGIRYISIDTTNRDFMEGGVIRHRQFTWLENELSEAEAAGELVIAYGHHTLQTMENGADNFDELEPLLGDIDPLNPPSEYPMHFGEKGVVGGLMAYTAGNPPPDDPVEGPYPDDPVGKSIEELFLEHPNVIAYVSGHEHENKVTPYPLSEGEGGFWEIATAAHIDWPQQSRLIDVFDNCDGSLSIFGTLVDHAGPTDPGDSPDLDDPLQLASVARELSFNDYQADTGEDGTSDARGPDSYRNVELVNENPLGQTAACTKQDEGGGGDGSGATSGGSTATEQGALDTAAPEITRFKASKKRASRAKIRRNPGKAVSFKLELSEDATIKIKLVRKLKGGKTKTIGSFKVSGKAGNNKVKVPASLAKKLARIASYTATAQATDAAGNKSGKESVGFKVVRR